MFSQQCWPNTRLVDSRMSETIYGQIIIGPPGSGKTTYCRTIQELLRTLKRKVVVVNIDPANDIIPYECAINISSLITEEDAMKELHLGPNGSLMYCMQYLEANTDWLLKQLSKYKGHYVLIDCPGQVELYTHDNSVKNIVQSLVKNHFSLCAVHLVDSYYCTDPATFVSALLTSLSTMLHIEMPHINVLSKLDLIEKYGTLHFNMDFYTDVLDLTHLVDILKDDPVLKNFKKLTSRLAELVQDYGLVSFYSLDIQNSESKLSVLKAADKANGYVYGTADQSYAL
ncbi:GPN-loop GTPase 2 [Chamberlinius hualienensis]